MPGHLWRIDTANYRHFLRRSTSGNKHLVCGTISTGELSFNLQRGVIFTSDSADTAAGNQANAYNVWNGFANAAATAWANPSNLAPGPAHVPFAYGNGRSCVWIQNAPPESRNSAFLQPIALRFTIPAQYDALTVVSGNIIVARIGAFRFLNHSVAGIYNASGGQVDLLRDIHDVEDGFTDDFYARFTLSSSLVTPWNAAQNAQASLEIEAISDTMNAPWQMYYGNSTNYIPIADSSTMFESVALPASALQVAQSNRTFWLIVTPGYAANNPASYDYWEFGEAGYMSAYTISDIKVEFELV